MSRALPVSISNINRKLYEVTLEWDGVLLVQTTEVIKVPEGNGVAIWITNNTDKDVDVTFTYILGTDETFMTNMMEESVTNQQHKILGPYHQWPMFDGGKIVLTYQEAPANGSETYIRVQEV